MPQAAGVTGETKGSNPGREYTRIDTKPDNAFREFDSRSFALIRGQLLLMRRRWKILIVALVVAVLAAAWQSMQDARFRRLLADYQHDLHPGMPRTTIDNYLQSHPGKQGVVRLGGSGTAWSYLVRIGTEPGLCGWSRVYIALNFDSTEQKELAPPPGDPSDVLKDIRLKKIGDCL
jgi:hypothetical protein